MPDKINISPVQASQLQSLGRALDEAQKELRGGKVDDELLKQIGMTPPQYQSFVESYSQLFGKVKPLLAVTERPTATVNNAFFAPGTQQVQTGKGLDSKLGVSGTEKLTGDQMKKLNESRAARVSPEYRKSVDAYFRSVSEGSAPPSPASGPAR